MSIFSNSTDRPARTLIAYCALAERLSQPRSNMFQALVPFFAEACQDFAGEFFDATKFSNAVRKNYGIEIPKLAALGIAEQLANEGILEVVSGYANSTTYKYSTSIKSASKEVSSITETDVQKILELFRAYCANSIELSPEKSATLHSDFLDRLLHIDSMRLLARRDASIATKKTASTLLLNKGSSESDEEIQHSLRLDFLVSSFLIDLRESDLNAFETVSNIAFANMAAEAIACFREPTGGSSDLSGLTVLLDTPLVLDMLGVNAEYHDYGKDLLKMMKESGCNIAVLDHSIAEAENTIQAKLTFLRSGINQLAMGTSAKPNFLAALSSNVAERVETRLGITVKKDPEINLHRRSQTTVGDIESQMTTRMSAWRNEDAKDHDRQSVWAMLALRDAVTLQPRICQAGWLMLTRNTPLLKISNDSWKIWLKGSTRHSQASIERWAPMAMTDKQFAGYVWARNGGGPSTISQSLLLAHCSAAVRPRADIKAKAYNLLIEMHGQEEALDIVALFEDREGGRALMRATLGDPEDVTAQRMPYILERVKLAAGEFAAAHAREEAKIELELERVKSLDQITKIQKDADEKNALLQIENSEKVLEIFNEKERGFSLETHAQNLRADLKTKSDAEQDRRGKVFKKGFEAGLREYRSCRILCVLIFGFAGWFIPANIFDLSPSISTLLTVLFSIAGFWFVPDLIQPLVIWFANRRASFVMRNIDPDLNILDMSIDYKIKTWSLQCIEPDST